MFPVVSSSIHGSEKVERMEGVEKRCLTFQNFHLKSEESCFFQPRSNIQQGSLLRNIDEVK
jgi:hypothetical protein